MSVFLSLVQLVAGIAVVQAPCPTYQTPSNCYEPATRTIYVRPGAFAPQYTLLHEYGHAWDYERLSESDRASLQRLLGYPAATSWWGDNYPPGEAFANAYADCALGLRRRLPALCALLPASAYAVVRRARLLAAR